jgi:hypothetical protein
MTQTVLIAQITGEAYRHMLDWRQDIDLQLIQFQLDHDREALVIMYEPKFGMRRITELPAPGTARPHTSSFGGGYEYCFLHRSTGWMLSVTNTTQRSFRFAHVAPIPPLLIEHSAGVSVDLRPSEGVRWTAARGLQDDSGSMPVDRTAIEAQFTIDDEMYERLLAWGWTQARLTEYQYCFVPLSVGCEIMVEHPASGTKNHLTKDVGW